MTLINTYNPSEKTKDVVVEVKESNNNIILFNDEVNTFDFVIDTLIELCKHEPEQAEQCALIVHHKGKCDVKAGEYIKLEPICSEMLRRGLSAEIQ